MNHTYAFVGLTPSERSLLESIFALDADNGPEDALVAAQLLASDSVGPDLLVVNGDDLAVAQRLSDAYPRALLVLVGQPRGSQPVPWPVMRRPLDLHGAVAVLSELDWPESAARELPARAVPADRAAAPAPEGPPSMAEPAEPADASSSAFAPTTASAPLASGGARAAEPLSARLAWAMSEIDAADVGTAAASEPSTQPRAGSPSLHARPQMSGDVLLVHARGDGQSLSLARGLRRMGYVVSVVHSADEALLEMNRHLVPFVFLDQPSLGVQLLPLARQLNAMRSAPTQPPHLAIVARSGSSFDRLRAAMAGCAWMRVPINKHRLADYLERRGLPRPRNGRGDGAPLG